MRPLFALPLNWLLLIALVAVAASLNLVHPYTRPFLVTDPSISYPKTRGTIPNSALIMLGTIFPAFVLLCISAGERAWCSPATGGTRGWRVRVRLGRIFFRRVHLRWYCLGVSLAMTMLVTDCIKNVSGRTRPDFLERCRPRKTEGWATWEDCAGDSWKDGFRSFPSGHASITFAGNTYLTLFLLPLIRPLLPTYPLLSLLSLLPLLNAAIVAATRLGDNRHHPLDILVGAIIGISFAFVGTWVRREMEGGVEKVENVKESLPVVEERVEGLVERRREGLAAVGGAEGARKFSIAEERPIASI